MSQIKINDFNKDQSILVASGPKEAFVSKDTPMVAVKDFADYEAGETVPPGDPFRKAVVDELSQEQIPSETTTNQVGGQYGVEFKAKNSYRGINQEFDIVQQGKVKGHVRALGLQFSQAELSAQTAAILGVPNKMPLQMQAIVSPGAGALMRQHGIELKGNTLLKNAEVMIDFTSQAYEDANMALYVAVDQNNHPGKLKITVIEVDREQQTGYLDPVSGEMTDVTKHSLVK